MLKTTLAMLVFILVLTGCSTLSCEQCIVLSPKDRQEILVKINILVEEAYAEGVKDATDEAFEALKDNPKLCPKDI